MHADPLAAYAYRWFEPIAKRSTIDQYFGRFWKHLRRLDATYDMVISASDDLSTRLRAGGLANVVTNPMGVDPGVFSPGLRDDGLRRGMLARCDLPPEASLLLGVGRMAPEKRWPMVIEAVAASGYRHPIGLLLVGNGRDAEAIRQQIGANPHIRMLGAISDRAALARLMASSDALIHGCEAETFCMAAAEALASGLPIIAPDKGGAADQARAAGQWLYASGNSASASETICHFIEQSRKTRPVAMIAPRTMDDHFADLFACYEQALWPVRMTA
jgi:alpha-1,6-mannosyltransferase